MNQITKQAKRIVAESIYAQTAIEEEYNKRVLNACKEALDNFWKQPWIGFEGDGMSGLYSSELGVAIPVLKNYNKELASCWGYKNTTIAEYKVRKIFSHECPSEIRKALDASSKTFNYLSTYYHIFPFSGDRWFGVPVDKKDEFKVGNLSDSAYRWGERNYIPFISIDKTVFRDAVIKSRTFILKNSQMAGVYKILNGQELDAISAVELPQIARKLSVNIDQIAESLNSDLRKGMKMNAEACDIILRKLMDCDKERVELESYDYKRMQDVNLGHWELWDQSADNKREGTVILNNPLIARNPEADIHTDGLIGIDFGTKSTIVSIMDGRDKISFLRIGIGQLSKQAKAFHYENPTIVEIVDLNSFRNTYEKKAGRPYTSIQDITVSHKANNNLKECVESDYFYSYFYDIKQWCGDRNRQIKLMDQKGKEYMLPAFVDLKSLEFNPLEIYAYYLGMFINNMRNGIYMKYLLSFPVTYEKAVKQKITESFEAGLKKSLPTCILKNDEIMKNFQVKQGVSEPAAYAITALQEYGFDPDDDEKVLYAVYDFGGGTTDFDFGVWRSAEDTREERRYDYVIEHFGSEGDRTLGGENLLELLAFEVFKANAAMLQSGKQKDSVGFSFSKPRECEAFPGSEILISDSQEAKRNLKNLMEVLRPFWEGNLGLADQNRSDSKNNNEELVYNGYRFRNSDTIRSLIETSTIHVDLIDRNGKSQPGQVLYIDHNDFNIHVNLIDILEKRIRRGVQAFFDSITLAFRHMAAVDSQVNEIQIFLAGNSSKSPILRKCFNELIEKKNQEISKKSQENGNHFILFPPLGTEEAYEIQRAKGIPVNPDDLLRPTGKTGVAYGLLKGRDSGKIKVISEISADTETKFRFNLGRARKGKFKQVIDRNDIEYGKWEVFIDAGVDEFEIYYTSIPGASKLPIDHEGIFMKRGTLPYVDENADVYIRAISPEMIEYTVSNGIPNEKSKPMDIMKLS